MEELEEIFPEVVGLVDCKGGPLDGDRFDLSQCPYVPKHFVVDRTVVVRHMGIEVPMKNKYKYVRIGVDLFECAGRVVDEKST